jgi:hypothetical protein
MSQAVGSYKDGSMPKKEREQVLSQSLSDYRANLQKDAKTQSLVVIGVLIVAGYFAYKKFKK